MRRWLARLAFSFVILAAWLVWEGRKRVERGESAAVHYVGAGLLTGAAMAGFRERHRAP